MILNSDYTYNTLSFIGAKGNWRLIGTHTGSSYRVEDAIDTFTDDKGNYVDYERRNIKHLENIGAIKAIKNEG